MESQRDRDTAFDKTIAGAMSRELHKTAQPLTILQGLLEFMTARVSAGDECSKFIERAGNDAPQLVGCDECRCFLKRAGEELPRLATYFNDVRKLAGLQRPARDITHFPLSVLVKDVEQNLRSDLYIAGITVVVDVEPNAGGRSVMVNASHSRVFTAVRLVLTTLADCVYAGDRITISVGSDGSNAMINFLSSRHSSVAIAERDLWRRTVTAQLEYAQLLFASAGGELRLDEAPEIVVMSLPTVASAPANQDERGKAMHV